MAESAKTTDYGKEIMGWRVAEYDKHERTKNWYVLAVAAALLLVVYSLWTSNFLFAAIIILGALVVMIHDNQEPLQVDFSITDQGVIVGQKFYDYDALKDFSLVYKPHQNIKNLYFEFKNVVRPRLSIPLNNHNPLPIREILLKYLPEDLERTDQPLSEALAKMFKL